MTAKEMVKNCAKQIKFTNKEPLEHFIFLKKDLESFVSQLCKEQRELCARRAWSMQYEFDPITLGIQYDEFIQDSQQPQIFEEGK